MTSLVTTVSTIFFDFDGTIRHSEPRGSDVFQKFAAQSGAVFTHDQRLEGERWLHYYWAQSRELIEDIQAFGSSENREFWWQHARRHLLILGVEGKALDELSRSITEKMVEDYQPEDKIPDDVFLTLQTLKEDGYYLGLVSNRDGGLQAVLDELHLSEFFDLILAAGEVGSWKPDPGLLEHALQIAEVNPDQAVYVGDNYYADVIAAQAAGIKPVLIDPLGLYPDSKVSKIQTIGELPSVLNSL
jgi:putative hydrolase of the HAD superfamily